MVGLPRLLQLKFSVGFNIRLGQLLGDFHGFHSTVVIPRLFCWPVGDGLLHSVLHSLRQVSMQLRRCLESSLCLHVRSRWVAGSFGRRRLTAGHDAVSQHNDRIKNDPLFSINPLRIRPRTIDFP